MISNRPYLLRAFYQWIVDSKCTPILVINATHPKCRIPQDYIDGGEIVFNISSAAVRDLKITNELVEFKASFSGVIHIISAPISAILAVYAEENGEGLFFDGEEETGTSESATIAPPQLTTIESFNNNILDAEMTPLPSLNGSGQTRQKPVLKLVE